MTAKSTGGEWVADDAEQLIRWASVKVEHSGPWLRWRAPYLAGVTPGLAAAAALGRVEPLVLSAAGAGAAAYSEKRWGMDRWRRTRLRHRWEKSAKLGRGSRLRRVTVHDRGWAECVVSRRDGNWTAMRQALHLEDGESLGDLRLDREWGEPFRFKLSDHGHRNPHRTRTLSLYYKRLPNSWTGLRPYVEPFVYPRLAIGAGYEGTVFADMRTTPHLVIVGATRSGKGVLAKSIETQAIRGGCLGVTIDGGASPEHGPLLDCPTWRAPMDDPSLDLAGQLRAATRCVADIHAEALARKALCAKEGVDTWQALPPAVKAKHPPIFLICDELTTLLAPTGEKDLDGLRKTLAVKLDTEGLRNGGKFGVMVVLCDQMFYSGALSKGATQQARGRVVLGNFASEHEKQMAGFTGLPTVTEENCAGHWGIANDDPASWEEIRVYPNTRAELEAAVKWSRGEGS